MPEPASTLIILSPAFAEHEQDSWLPAQEAFVRSLNRLYPALKVSILSFHYPVLAQKEYQWFGNEVTAFSGGMKGKWSSPGRWYKVWQKLKKLRRERQVIGIFSFFCSECAFIGHYFAKRYRLQHRIWVLGQDAKAENKQVRRIRPAPDELIAISDFLVREFTESHGIRPTHMIPTGIDPASFPEQTGQRDIDIMAAGSLIPLKQYAVFIEIIRQLSAHQPGIRAVLCGDGPELAALKTLVAAYKLEHCITFTGNLPRASVLAWMQRSKVFLHPSRYEGFGMVCAEALYAGAGVISFCKPLDHDIPHWHIVQDMEEMKAKTLYLLQQQEQDHEPVLTFSAAESAREIMRCFGYPAFPAADRSAPL